MKKVFLIASGIILSLITGCWLLYMLLCGVVAMFLPLEGGVMARLITSVICFALAVPAGFAFWKSLSYLKLARDFGSEEEQT